MTDGGPALPTDADWRELGVRIGPELHGGHQSRVFDAEVEGQRVAVKLTDAELTDGALLAERSQLVERLAATTGTVARPLPLGGALTSRIGSWFVMATVFVEGRSPDVMSVDDAHRLGSTLAELHGALRLQPPGRIPPVAALANSSSTDAWQLLHGDFSHLNVIIAPGGMRVVDFDDCGTGPIEHDLAMSLYMVRFDDAVSARAGNDVARSAVFRPAFLDGYASAVGKPVDVERVDDLIVRRIRTLGRWIDEPSTAPIGIRTASAEWHRTLRDFVTSELGTDPTQRAPSGDAR